MREVSDRGDEWRLNVSTAGALCFFDRPRIIQLTGALMYNGSMSDHASTTFIALCLSEKSRAQDIDDFVDRWHDSASDESLRECLGMSEAEYAVWINDTDVLPDIIAARQQKRPLADVISDRKPGGAR